MRFIINLLFTMVLTVAVINCGSSTSTSSTSSSTDTGSIVVTGGTSVTSSNDVSSQFATTSGTASSVYVQTFKIDLYEAADCSGTAVNIVDETADEANCVESPSIAEAVADDNFVDITSSPEMASNDSVAAGEYNCVAIRLCDQVVFETSITECSEANMDVSGDPDTVSASVNTYHWSTDGTNGGEGTSSDPMLLSTALTIESDTETDVTFNMYNNTTSGGWDAEYDDVEESCDVEQPVMDISSS
jgi:hypothetical protein